MKRANLRRKWSTIPNAQHFTISRHASPHSNAKNLVKQKRQNRTRVKYWEIIAANIRRPENDRSPCTTSVLILATVALLPFVTLAQHAPPAQPFQRLDGCVLTPDEWTDGDSFRVRLPDGRLATFRLYFVDTTESRSRGVRSDAQAIPILL